jgi:hypothetical protein
LRWTRTFNFGTSSVEISFSLLLPSEGNRCSRAIASLAATPLGLHSIRANVLFEKSRPEPLTRRRLHSAFVGTVQQELPFPRLAPTLSGSSRCHRHALSIARRRPLGMYVGASESGASVMQVIIFRIGQGVTASPDSAAAFSHRDARKTEPRRRTVETAGA